MASRSPSELARDMYRYRGETVGVDYGAGPAIVFSHGTLMDWTMFEPQLEAFSGEYRTLAYNHRARTEHGHVSYDLGDLVGDCRAFLDGAGVDSCVLAGMSMGGFMGLRFALDHPDVLDGLVLIDSMAKPHPEEEQAEYTALIEATRDRGYADEETAELVATLLFGETTHAEQPDLVERWTQRWLSYPGEAIFHETNSWLDRPGVDDRLDQIDIPVLILHGAEDAALEPERARPMVESLPDARMELIPEAGHSSNLENPEPVNAALRDFLENIY